jgi:hypothetical protein
LCSFCVLNWSYTRGVKIGEFEDKFCDEKW